MYIWCVLRCSTCNIDLSYDSNPTCNVKPVQNTTDLQEENINTQSKKAPHVRSVVVSLQTSTLFMTIWNAQLTVDYEISLLHKSFVLSTCNKQLVCVLHLKIMHHIVLI